jgi:LuxR family transcriptional regulator, transcriptional regulator of spore coat protein
MTLTNREIQILQLIIAELTTGEIAIHLGISTATVETHRRHLLRKMGVKSVVGLVKEAIRQNLVQ